MKERRQTLAVSITGLLALWLVGSSQYASAGLARPTAPSNHFYQHEQIVQFNTYGGNGNALTGFNTQVWEDITDSIMARDPYPRFLSLNEVCEKGYGQLRYILNTHGYGYGPNNSSGYTYDHTVSLGDFLGGQIGEDPIGTCGAWYGNATLLRGVATGGGAGWFSSYVNISPTSGERRNWMCKESGSAAAFCTAHVENQQNGQCAVPDQAAQTLEYRNIGVYVSGSGAYALGDFNCDPYLSGWQSNGFTEIDHPPGSGGFRCTTSGCGHKWDYIWRRNTVAFAHPAYIFLAAHSDHRWVQAYI